MLPVRGDHNTHLEHIDTCTRNVADDVIFLVEVTSKHLRRLIHGMLDFDCNSTTSLRFLDQLENN